MLQLIGWLGLALLAPAAHASDAFVAYQGLLVDPVGGAIDGSHTVRITLYSNESGTPDLWRTTFDPVLFAQGYFRVELTGEDDGSTPRDLDDVVGIQPLYVGVSIDGSADLQPLQQLGTSIGGGSLPGACPVGALPYASGGGWACTNGGRVLQELSTSSASTTVGSWPSGATSSSSGSQIMTLTITPSHTGSTLEVQAIAAVRENGNTSNNTGMGLFRNSESTALAVSFDNGAFSPYSHGTSSQGTVSHHETLRWTGIAADTSPVTFKVRIGAGGSSDLACNPGICTLVVRETL
jgi:hypothetical protein